MRIDTVKKNLRTNHTVRWAGYEQPGTKRNGIVDACAFIHRMKGLGASSGFVNKKYTDYFPVDDTNVSDMPDDYQIYEIKPSCDNIIKYDSSVRCCTKCGGTRYSCLGVFHETNQYGKGIYRQRKYQRTTPIDDYYDYIDGIDDAFNDMNDLC